MKWYMKQETGAGKDLFTVYNACCDPVYRLAGDMQILGGKVRLCDEENREVARITHMGLAGISRYTIVIGEKECARVLQNLASSKTPYRLRGVDWRLRGDVSMRSFDIVDANDAIVMSHGRCWEACGESFAIDVENTANDLLCICIAAVIDSSALAGAAVALPVS